MTAKIMISVSDDLKEMIDEYNNSHMFKKLHISEICQQAIYDFISKDFPKTEPIKKDLVAAIIEVEKQPKQQSVSEDTDKPTIPCPICGTMFVQTIPTRKFCSKKCGTQASRLRKKTQ